MYHAMKASSQASEWVPTIQFGGWLRAQIEREHLSARERIYCPGQLIYMLADPAESLYFLIEGAVELAKLSFEGKKHSWDICLAGEVFGELALYLPRWPRQEEAGVLRTARVLRIEAADLLRGIRLSDQDSLLLAWLGTRLLQAETVIEALALRNVEQRLGWVLLRYHEKATTLLTGWSGVLDFSHEELARMVGTSRQVITRLMKAYRQRGLAKTSRRWIKVEPEKLRSWLAAGGSRGLKW